MKTYRLLDIERGFIELQDKDLYWLKVTKKAKRHVLLDDCPFAHAEYGSRLIANENVELIHILEPGKVVTIEYRGNPVYLITDDIIQYNIVHHSPMMCSINLR